MSENVTRGIGDNLPPEPITEADMMSGNVTESLQKVWDELRGDPIDFYISIRDHLPNLPIREAFRLIGKQAEWGSIQHFREGTRPAANDREKEQLQRYHRITDEARWERPPRALTAAERKFVERLRRAGLIETREHEKARDRIEYADDPDKFRKGDAWSETGMNPAADFDKMITWRHLRRLSNQRKVVAWEKKNPPTPEQLARRAEVKRFNTLAAKWTAFENAFAAAPEEDIATLCRNFPETMATLLIMARRLWTHASLEQMEAVKEMAARLPATFDAIIIQWPVG